MLLDNFKNGMLAGAKPFEKVYKKQESALRRVAVNLDGRLDKIDGVTNSLLNDMDGIKRKELYDLNAPPIDLKSLKQEEKEYLAAGLYTLAEKCKNTSPSPFQQAFARSIQAYIGVKAPQTVINLSKITSIDSAKKQRAIMQVFMEYLFLEKEDFSFFSEYPDIFDNFSVNEIDREAILQAIRAIYKAVDSGGFIEKYGFVPEISDMETGAAQITGTVELEKLIIKNRTIHISTGEIKKYTAKEIQFNSDIDCHGSLIFDHCVIIYNGDEIKGRIRLSQNASLTIKNCTIVGNNNPVRAEKIERFFVEGEGETSAFTVENTLFYDCFNFANNVEAHISDSIIRYSKLPPPNALLFDCCYNGKSKMVNCLVESLEIEEDMVKRLIWNYRLNTDDDGSDKDWIDHYAYFRNFFNIPDSSKEKTDAAICAFFGISSKEMSYDKWRNAPYSLYSYESIAIILGQDSFMFRAISQILGQDRFIFRAIHQYSGCTFKNIAGYLSSAEDIKQCQFFNCFKIIEANDNFNLDDCVFKNCGDIIKLGNNVEVSRCQFFNCSGNIADLFQTSKITGCYFHQIYNGQIKFHKCGDYDLKIKDCHFDGIYTGGRVGADFISCLYGDKIVGSLENCEFKHCVEADQDSKIVKQYEKRRGIFNSERTVTIIEIRNCPTLKNVNKEDYTFEDVEIWTETDTDDPIGARLDEAAIGVPGVSPGITPAA
jgi:hypothetical protein